jgi:hypothetical protein
MPYVRREGVSMDIGGPFMLCSVGVSGSDVSGLELLELLLGAKFIGLRRGEPPRCVRNGVAEGEGEREREGEKEVAPFLWFEDFEWIKIIE